jgi:hypothetical protein
MQRVAGLIAALALVAVGLFGMQSDNNAATQVFDKTPVQFEKQVLKLPEDGNAYYTSLFLRPGDEQIEEWFKTNPALASLRKQTHFNVYYTNTVRYRRYQKMVPVAPAVVIQKPDGQKVYHEAGKDLPTTASGLAADIDGTFMECFLRPRRPRGPAPDVTPEDEPTDEPTDDEPTAKDGPPKLDKPAATPVADTPWLLVGIGLMIGLGAGIASKFHEQYSSQG